MRNILWILLIQSVIILGQVPSDSLRGFWKDNAELKFEYEIFNNSTKEFDRYKLTTSENGDIQNKIRAITAIFKRNKSLNPPMGAAVYFYGEGGTEMELPSRNYPRSFKISLLSRRLFKDCDTCKIILASEADNLISISVNNITSILTFAPYKNDINNNPIPLYERWFISHAFHSKYHFVD